MTDGFTGNISRETRRLSIVSRETISRETSDEQDKECSKCKSLMPADREARYCKECHAEYMVDWRAKNKITAADRKLLLKLKGRS